MNNPQSEVDDPDVASHRLAAGGSGVDAREQIQQRMSALELGKRSIHGPFVYVVGALVTILGSSIRSDYPFLAMLVVASLSLLAVARVLYARGFESRYDRVGERAVRDFTILLVIQCSIFSWSAGAVAIHYGEEVESILALLFGISAAAAGTSSLAPRVGVHRVFLAALMTPLLVCLIPGFGELGIGLLVGSLVMVAFYLREVTLASAALTRSGSKVIKPR